MLDSYSIWHSTQLTGIDFEALKWGRMDPSVTEKSATDPATDTEGGLLHI